MARCDKGPPPDQWFKNSPVLKVGLGHQFSSLFKPGGSQRSLVTLVSEILI